MLRVKNWFRMYKRRKHERSISEEELFIENCAMIVDCPMKYSDLTPLNERGDGTRFCNVCNKNVYRTDSLVTLRELTKKGQCVSFYVLMRGQINPYAPPAQMKTGCFVL